MHEACSKLHPVLPADTSMQVSWVDLAPAFASKTNLLLELDCGTQLPAHSAFLAHASSVLAEAIDLAAKPADGDTLRLPVACVSHEQAALLLQVSALPPCRPVQKECQLTASGCSAGGLQPQA